MSCCIHHCRPRLAPLKVFSATSLQQPPEWSVLGQVNCFSPLQPPVWSVLGQVDCFSPLTACGCLHLGHSWSPQQSLSVHRRCLALVLSSMQEMCSNKDRCLDNVCEQWLVGLALNFIIGDKVTPLNAKKHMETPLMGSIDPAYILVMLTGKRQCTSIGDSIRHISVMYSCVCVCVCQIGQCIRTVLRRCKRFLTGTLGSVVLLR